MNVFKNAYVPLADLAFETGLSLHLTHFDSACETCPDGNTLIMKGDLFNISP